MFLIAAALMLVALLFRLGAEQRSRELGLLGALGFSEGRVARIVLAEAMAMQAPIVAHPNEGYRWTLRDTGRLSLVDCKDPVAYAERD